VEQLPLFLLLPAGDDRENTILVNISQIRNAHIDDGDVRLCFSETHEILVTGKTAGELKSLFLTRTILADGSPFVAPTTG